MEVKKKKEHAQEYKLQVKMQDRQDFIPSAGVDKL